MKRSLEFAENEKYCMYVPDYTWANLVNKHTNFNTLTRAILGRIRYSTGNDNFAKVVSTLSGNVKAQTLSYDPYSNTATIFVKDRRSIVISCISNDDNQMGVTN